jgi:hypothetical protein
MAVQSCPLLSSPDVPAQFWLSCTVLALPSWISCTALNVYCRPHILNKKWPKQVNIRQSCRIRTLLFRIRMEEANLKLIHENPNTKHSLSYCGYTHCGCHAISILSWHFSHCRLVTAVLLWRQVTTACLIQFCLGCIAKAVLSWPFCSSCPVQAVMFWLSRSGYPVFWLSCSGCPILLS